MIELKSVASEDTAAILWPIWAALPTHRPYAALAGGCVRDLIHNKVPRDWDVLLWGIDLCELEDIVESLRRVGWRVTQVHGLGYGGGEPDGSERVHSVVEMARGSAELDLILYGQNYQTLESCLLAHDFNINAVAHTLSWVNEEEPPTEQTWFAYDLADWGTLRQTREVLPERAAKVMQYAKDLGWVVP